MADERLLTRGEGEQDREGKMQAWPRSFRKKAGSSISVAPREELLKQQKGKVS